MKKFLDWSENHPTKAGILLLFTASLLFGDRVIETLKAIAELLKEW